MSSPPLPKEGLTVLLDPPTESIPQYHELHRASQYAENALNPAPELAMVPGIEPVLTVPAPAPMVPDGAEQYIASTVETPPPPTASQRALGWAKRHKCFLIGLAVILLVGLVVAPIAVAFTAHHSKDGNGPGSTTTVSSSSVFHTATTSLATSTSQGSSSSTTTTTTTTSSNVPQVSGCPSAHIVERVEWMGIAGATGGWWYKLSSSPDAPTCCDICFYNTTEGCDAWAFILGNGGDTSTSCNIIYGWNGTNEDETCPSGHTSVRLIQGGLDPTHQGGTGPCAGLSP